MANLISYLKLWSGRLLVVWLVSVLALSVVPTPNYVNDTLHMGKVELRIDYLFHLIMFASGSFLALLYSSHRYPPAPSIPKHNSAAGRNAIAPLTTAVTIVILILMAVAHEYIQRIITWRAFNVNDIVSNVAGVITGSVIALLMLRYCKTIHNKP